MGGKGSGRRPKRTTRTPTAILKLRGTYRQDRHGDRELEPQPEGEPVMPSTFKGEAAKIWKRIVPDLVAMGVAKRIDSDALAELCLWKVRWNEVSKVKDNEYKTISQLAAISKNLNLLYDRFGMNPVARSRISVTPKPEPKSEMAKFLDGVM